ncbi:dihydrofolate reductase family protein [Kribbella sp. C-35]|uniref:dihydrofolate reductase family protein n=1 Tax=Kribbella sp. C-35 TaxID=2789276 RepID=UPI00397DA68D
MRKVVLYQLMSLDGVAEEPGDWLFDTDDAIFENLGQIIGDQDAVLMGRRTYEYWVDYWPTSDFEPFASFINRTEKHIFTSSPLTKEWANSTPVSSPAAAYVADLKERPGKDIGIHGSIDLARSLLRARLVDELRLVIAPTIAASGRRLFDSDDALQKLDMVDAVRTPTGALLAHYRLEAPQAGASD